ncbi:MAG: 3-deoxy-manno-octulosonate cytidylyltransferase [Campylobacter sp.]|uniref:3-deoxy-manno-octulosonate cytidylyltransferase n=1 Tax=Campylobacter sp. P0109 TaxID=1895606 RepID=UPI000A35050E|nr:3-deoxy-manno-octulosonate cytidylyltransferase [Campylobacter sp. P0109]MBR2149057.1 3-deoxy-manno-octulosonate cytidylyltransferase [Campylobacter sp.]MBR2222100.1 3-deoxy-manno-octulosonate cytidylyltransferase [Campylobacter sp.]MBR6611871.1 3-deoxy-manno-octulosonate cytidylyltransferase [Campylobacter sp.]
MKIIGIIPARYNSSRFPGKPLVSICGIPMIKRTYLQAQQSHLLNDLMVATDSQIIFDFCHKENIPVILTSSNHKTGTDRIAEVAKQIRADLYINIQGDEPVIDPLNINLIVKSYQKWKDKYIAYNLYKTITETNEINANSIIKVITNQNDELMYMSRFGIPYNKTDKIATHKKQVCVYGFSAYSLDIFSSSSKTLNEYYEDIEILRFLDLGYKVKMEKTNLDSISVDTPDDIIKVENFIKTKA